MDDSTAHDFAQQVDETVVATARCIDAVSGLSDDQAREPSLLPGWTRGHLVTHLARNADALANVLHGAQAGEVRAMYPSQEERDAAIEAGAGRPASELCADLVAASGRWHQAAEELHATNLENTFLPRPEREPVPVRRVAVLRRTEVEVHHADLGLGYTAVHWPDDFVALLMKRRERELAADEIPLRWSTTDTGEAWGAEDGPEVTGPRASLVWWLLGRGSGEDLTSSSGELPDLGRWA